MERGESSSIAIVPLGGNQEEDDNIVNRLSSGYRFHPTDEEIAIVPFGGNQEEDDNIMNRLASGYRFHPTDEGIMADYLIKKISNRPLTPNKIIEVDLSKYNPEDLADYTTKRIIGQAMAGKEDPSRPIEDSTSVSNEDNHVYVVNKSNFPMISENAQVCIDSEAIHKDLTHVNFNQFADSSAMISMDAHIVNEPIPIEDPSHAVNQSGDSSDNDFGDSSRCPCGELLGYCLCDPSLVLDYWVDPISSEISFSPPKSTHKPES